MGRTAVALLAAIVTATEVQVFLVVDGDRIFFLYSLPYATVPEFIAVLVVLAIGESWLRPRGVSQFAGLQCFLHE